MVSVVRVIVIYPSLFTFRRACPFLVTWVVGVRLIPHIELWGTEDSFVVCSEGCIIAYPFSIPFACSSCSLHLTAQPAITGGLS